LYVCLGFTDDVCLGFTDEGVVDGIDLTIYMISGCYSFDEEPEEFGDSGMHYSEVVKCR